MNSTLRSSANTSFINSTSILLANNTSSTNPENTTILTTNSTTTIQTTDVNITTSTTLSSISTTTNSTTSDSLKRQLITNGGFETGDFTAWEYGGSAAVESKSASTGSYAAHLGPNDFIQFILPSIAASATDSISFDACLSDRNSALYVVLSFSTGQEDVGYNLVYAVTTQPGNPLALGNNSGNAVFVLNNQPTGLWLKFSRIPLADLISSGLPSRGLTYSEIAAYDQSIVLGGSAGEYVDDLSLLVNQQVSAQSMSFALPQTLLIMFGIIFEFNYDPSLLTSRWLKARLTG